MIPLKNNKARVGLGLWTIGLIVAVVLTIILGIAFIASTAFKFYIIGGIIIFLSLIYGLRSPKFTRNRTIVIVLAFMTGIIFILLPAFGIVQTAFSTTFTPVYCNDYSFTCCSEVKATSTNLFSTFHSGIQCPSNSNYCKIVSFVPSTNYASRTPYVGSVNCQDSYHPLVALFGNSFDCDDGKAVSTSHVFRAGEYVYVRGGAGTFSLEIARDKLFFTGRAGSTTGVSVLGADGCSFNPSVIYNSQGRILKNVDTSKTSYVVPRGECILTYVPGDRHICGNLEEQCRVDTDCTGHTYGNKECIGRTLQTYGCRQLNQLPTNIISSSGSYIFKPFTESSISSSTGDSDANADIVLKRCEIVDAQQVQCCGDTDCGSNAVCDTSTFTCKEPDKVICIQDADCGVSVQCDRVTKTLRTPVCNSGNCGYDTESIECCTTNDCASGDFCGSDYKCKQSADKIQECPGECCISESSYFDKPCADGLFCIGNVCVSNGCTNDNQCQTGQECVSGNCQDKVPPTGECSWYQEYLVKEEQQYSWYNYIGIGTPKTITTAGCYTSPVVYLVVIGILISGTVITVVILIRPKTNKNKRRKRK